MFSHISRQKSPIITRNYHSIADTRRLLSNYSELKTPAERKDFLFGLTKLERDKYVNAQAYYGIELRGSEFKELLGIGRKTKIIAYPNLLLLNTRTADRNAMPPKNTVEHLETDQMITSPYADINFAIIRAGHLKDM